MELTFCRPGHELGQSVHWSSAAPAPPEDALRRQAAAILVDLFAYLREHALRQPLLAPAVAALRTAVAQHRAGAADALEGPRTVYRLVQEVRRVDPSLPQP